MRPFRALKLEYAPVLETRYRPPVCGHTPILRFRDLAAIPYPIRYLIVSDIITCQRGQVRPPRDPLLHLPKDFAIAKIAASILDPITGIHSASSSLALSTRLSLARSLRNVPT